MQLGEPGAGTRGPRTPGREKAEEEVGGREADEPRPRELENWLESLARVSEWPGGGQAWGEVVPWLGGVALGRGVEPSRGTRFTA